MTRRGVCVGAVGLGLALLCLVETGCGDEEGKPVPDAVTKKFKSFDHVGMETKLIVATYASSNAPVLLKPPDAEYIPTFDNINRIIWHDIAGGQGWQVAPIPPGYTFNSEGQLYYDDALYRRYLGLPYRWPPVKEPASAAGAQTQPLLVYKAGANTNAVVAYDPSGATIVAIIPVGNHPRGLAGTPDGKQVWVTNKDSSSISVIDVSTQTVTATIPLPSSQPYGIGITPDGTAAYVANWTVPGAVYVVDVAKHLVTKTIAVGGRPAKLAVSPDGGQVWVTNNADGTVSVIDVLTNTVIKTIPLAAAAFGVAFRPNGTRVYVTAYGQLYTIDPANYQTVATLAVGTYPVDISIDPTGTEAFVCNRLSTFISHVDLTTNQLIENIDVGFSPEVATLVP